MEIRPIRTDADHADALAEIDRLWGAAPETEEGARLEILLTLVDAFEEAHHPIPDSDPVAAILFMMEQRGLRTDDLAPLIGRGKVDDVLNRRRPLTLPMIRRLSAELHIPTDILVRPYPVKRAA